MSEFGEALSKLAIVHLKRISISQTGVWGQSPLTLSDFLYLFEKIAILMPLNHILHVFRAI